VNDLSKKGIVFILLITMLFSLSACSKNEPKRYDASFLELFDTLTRVVGYADSEEEFKKDVQMIYDELKMYNDLYDIYHNYDGINNIKTINDNAGIAPVKVDKKIIDLLQLSIDINKKSHNTKNIAFGAVLSVWHQYRTEGLDNPEDAKLPPMELLQEKAKHTDIDDIIIDEENSTVYLSDPEMSLDVGSIAKGYATEMVSIYAKEHGFENGMLSVGGNVRTIGSKLDGKDGDTTWSVGIQNPDEESEQTNLYILGLNDYSLVTSGVYERYYVVDGKKYHHIIDPKTLMPTEYFLSVSIVTKSSAMADALTTVIFNMPYEEGLEFIESMDDTEALWVFHDGSMKYSNGFEKFIKK
jgi:thiamine biosynthesis lipoprotein